MGKSKTYSRRDFLKAGSLASTAFFLSSCTSLENVFSGEKRNFDDEVVILGAGLAGLAAAYTLKKNKIPYRLFEASPRIGGRVYTLQNFTPQDLFAELGGEFFEDNHRRTAQICKELSLEVQEIKPAAKTADRLFTYKNKLISNEEYKRNLKPLYVQLARHSSELFFNQDVQLTVDNMREYEKALYYDNQSAESFIRSFQSDVDSWVLDLFLTQVRDRYGISPDRLSALQLMSSVGRDPVLNFQNSKSTYRVRTGAGSLTRALYERVAGVIPDFIVKVNSPLVSVKKKTQHFELNVKVNGESQTFKARRVICTLPFSQLREVGGIGDLGFADSKMELILNQPYATQSKAAISFAEPFWRKKISTHPVYSGDVSGDLASHCFYNSGRDQEKEGALLGVLRTMPATAGNDEESKMLVQAYEDLEKLHVGAKNLVQSANVIHWGQRVWSKGSRAVFSPGQFHKFSGLAAKPECEGKFLFAGEHTSVEHSGTMEGALSSGILAAEALIAGAATSESK